MIHITETSVLHQSVWSRKQNAVTISVHPPRPSFFYKKDSRARLIAQGEFKNDNNPLAKAGRFTVGKSRYKITSPW